MEEGQEVFVLSDQSLESLRQMAATVSELSAAVASINQSIERCERAPCDESNPRRLPHSPSALLALPQASRIWLKRSARLALMRLRDCIVELMRHGDSNVAYWNTLRHHQTPSILLAFDAAFELHGMK
jgi:hypothetical protein